MSSSQKLLVVSIEAVRPNPVALRGVNRESEDYLGLVNSIKQGFKGSITVREQSDPETGQSFYEILDGLHRYTAAKDAGLTEIPVAVNNMSKDELLKWQIQANKHRIDTRPVEYTKGLRRLLESTPTMTVGELAIDLGVSITWLNNRLGLLKLNANIQTAVDSGQINLTNAIALSKLPEDEQDQFVDQAMGMSPTEFCPVVQARVKELSEARKQGRDPNAVGFSPVAHIQKKSEIEAEVASLSVVANLIDAAGATKAAQGAKIALEWVLNLDPVSLAAQKAKYDERMKLKAEAEAKRKAEREAKKAKVAAEAAAAVTVG